MADENIAMAPSPMEVKAALYVALTERKRELEAETETVTARLYDLQEELLEQFTKTGISQVRFGTEKGSRSLVSVRREVWAKTADRETTVAALKKSGLVDLVREDYSHQTLSAWIREQEKAGRPLPESFEGVIEANEVFKVRVTRS